MINLIDDGLEEEIRCAMCKNPYHNEKGCNGNCVYDEYVYKRIMEIFSERINPDVPEINVGKWIPVTERLPEEDVDVLVTVHFLGLSQVSPSGWNDYIKESYYVDIANHIDGEWASASDECKVASYRHKVIAWMPLPESYSGE